MTSDEFSDGAPGEEVEPSAVPGREEPLPEILPVLPLRNTVLFPSIVAPMAATTERAKRLVDDALAADRLIVTVAARDPEVTEPGAEDLYTVGTAVRILRMTKTEDGAQRLWVQGLRRVEIGAYDQTKPYLRAHVKALVEDRSASLELEALHRNVARQFAIVAEGSQTISEPVRGMVGQLEDSSALGDVVAANLGLTVADRQELLEQPDVQKRLERLSEHLAREAEVRSLEQEIRTQVQEELTRNQREYVLREQARAIRRQLGEYETPTEQVEELRRRIEEANVPENVMEVAERELGRLAAQPPGAMEAGTIRSYLEWIADLPWSTSTEDTLDIAGARVILDEDHYDIEKVKERILEFIAVLKLKRDLRGPILCFVGPPGTGKTSLGRSIARAVGRKFARLSLGGVRDEAEIRGHRRTYVELASGTHPADAAARRDQQPGLHPRRDRQARRRLPRRSVVGAARGAGPGAELGVQRSLPGSSLRSVEGALHRHREHAREHPAGAARPHGGDRAAGLHGRGQARDRAAPPAAAPARAARADRARAADQRRRDPRRDPQLHARGGTAKSRARAREGRAQARAQDRRGRRRERRDPRRRRSARPARARALRARGRRTGADSGRLRGPRGHRGRRRDPVHRSHADEGEGRAADHRLGARRDARVRHDGRRERAHERRASPARPRAVRQTARSTSTCPRARRPRTGRARESRS